MASNDMTEEEYFVKLFDDTFETNRGSLSDEDIWNASMKIRHSFTGSIKCEAENYQKPEMLWAYFCQLSPVSAGLTRARMLEAIQNSEEFRAFFERPDLEVLSIGSGPGSDLIGLCSALYDEVDFQKLNLTLVDNNKHWESLFEAMIEVARCGDYGNASRLLKVKELNTSFIWSDVLNISAYYEALRKADVVWMKGLLSVLNNNSVRYNAIEAICSSMAVESLLVLIDSPSYIQYASSAPNMRLVYSGVENVYSLPQPSEGYVQLAKKSNQMIVVFAKES